MSKTNEATASIVRAADALALPGATQATGTRLQQLGKRLFLQALARFQQGELTVVVPATGERHVFGRRTPACDLHATLEILHPQTFADAAFGGTVGGGEAYIRGLWRTDDLTALVRMFVANRAAMESFEGAAAYLSDPIRRVLHWFNRNSVAGSRRNIEAHYDLGNDLFAAVPRPDHDVLVRRLPAARRATLEEAALHKLDRICRQAAAAAGGSPAGDRHGLGRPRACTRRGTSAAGSRRPRSRKNQFDWAREKFAAAGLSERQVTMLSEDYRDLNGSFDKLVSVEMIEAVGHHFLDTYLAKCAALLKPAGRDAPAVHHDRGPEYEQALHSVDFIQKYIFPGGALPSVAAIPASFSRMTDLQLYRICRTSGRTTRRRCGPGARTSCSGCRTCATWAIPTVSCACGSGT